MRTLKIALSRTFLSAIVICLALGGSMLPTTAFAVELPATPGSTLQLHLDAFDPLGTGVQPAGGSTPATWFDTSGNLKNATVTNTPVYLTGDGTTIGGQPTFRFDTAGGADYYTTTGAGFSNTSTIFSVSKLNGGANARLITSSTVNWLLGYHGGVEDTGFNGNWFGAGGGGVPAATTSPHMYIHEAAISGTDTLWDGSTVIPNSRGPGATTAIGNLRLGGNGGENSNGDVSEVLIFDSDMPSADFNAVGLYLAQKYGFAAFGHDGSVLGGGPAGPAVPEPSAFFLAILSLLGLSFFAARRRRRVS